LLGVLASYFAARKKPIVYLSGHGMYLCEYATNESLARWLLESWADGVWVLGFVDARVSPAFCNRWPPKIDASLLTLFRRSVLGLRCLHSWLGKHTGRIVQPRSGRTVSI